MVYNLAAWVSNKQTVLQQTFHCWREVMPEPECPKAGLPFIAKIQLGRCLSSSQSVRQLNDMKTCATITPRVGPAARVAGRLFPRLNFTIKMHCLELWQLRAAVGRLFGGITSPKYSVTTLPMHGLRNVFNTAVAAPCHHCM
jgi:hypothetical protein